MLNARLWWVWCPFWYLGVHFFSFRLTNALSILLILYVHERAFEEQKYSLHCSFSLNFLARRVLRLMYFCLKWHCHKSIPTQLFSLLTVCSVRVVSVINLGAWPQRDARNYEHHVVLQIWRCQPKVSDLEHVFQNVVCLSLVSSYARFCWV